jgi:hypothetical protein
MEMMYLISLIGEMELLVNGEAHIRAGQQAMHLTSGVKLVNIK